MQSIIDKTKPKSGNAVKLMETFQREGEGDEGIKLPFPILNKLIGNGLRKGNSSIIAGPGGNGKSYWVYQVLLSLLGSSTAFKYIPLEYDATEHLRRIMAVRFKTWGMVENSKENAEARIGVLMNHPEERKYLERIEANICENPCAMEVVDGVPHISDVSYALIIELIIHLAKDNDFIVIDPITAIDHDPRAGNEWNQQKGFVKSVAAIAKHYNTHIMMVSHTGKRQKVKGLEAKLTMDDVAGSAAFSRFTQYMMLMDFHEKRVSTIKKGGGIKKEVEHERTMLIGKATHGPGKGQRLAFDFTDGPIMEELGWMTND